MMKIIYTKHLLLRLQERIININLVNKTILNPDLLLPKSPNRYRAISYLQKDSKQYLLIVIYDKVENNIQVITAFITSKIDKYISK